MKIERGLCSILIVGLCTLIGYNFIVTEGKSDGKIQNTNIIGNTYGNIVNNSFLAKQGDFMYLEKGIGVFSGGIYKVNLNGGNTKKITSLRGQYMNVVGEWIYLSASYGFGKDMRIYKININNGKKVILTNEGAYGLVVVGDWIYYKSIPDDRDENRERDVHRLYKIKTDGTNRTKLTDDKIGEFIVTEEWIYYGYKDKLYKKSIKEDNKEPLELGIKGGWSMNIDDDWIYYISQGKILKVKINGSYQEVINDDEYVESINVSNNVVYYITRDSRKLYKINTDGSNKIKISEDRLLFGINVIDDWIYYLSDNDADRGELIRVKIDGSLREKVK